MTLDTFWNSTWYELHLLSEQHRYREESAWNHTRHIMAAMTGEQPTKIMRLPTIDTVQKRTTTTKTDAQRILEKHNQLDARLHK